MTTTHITNEHVVVAANRKYDQVLQALEAQLGPKPDTDRLQLELQTTNPSWEQIAQILEQGLGPSGFTLFDKFEVGLLVGEKQEELVAAENR